MALPNSSKRRLISPHERPYPYRNARLQEHALTSMNGMGYLSSTSAGLCDRALPCSVRASLPMPFTAAHALLPALFTSTGSLPCARRMWLLPTFGAPSRHVALVGGTLWALFAERARVPARAARPQNGHSAVVMTYSSNEHSELLLPAEPRSDTL